MAKNLAALIPKLNKRELSWVGFILSEGKKYNGEEVPDYAEIIFKDSAVLHSRLESGHYDSYDSGWGPPYKSLKKKVREYVKDAK